jgi:glycosyltransferase involved in cell wall biosynthesis
MPDGPPQPGSELVSVIVTTRNSARTLEACLSSIRRQSHPDIELIVVDNGSTDLTPTIAGRYCDLVATKGPERSAQRNYGVELSHGAYVVLLDSDMVLDESVISEGVAALHDPAAKGVAIPEMSFGEGFWTRCRILERQCYIGDDDVEAARMFRRADFVASGGYDLELNGAEDWDLSARIAGRTNLTRTPSLIHHDEGRTTLRGSFVKRRYYAPGYLRYLAKHRNDALSQGNALLRPAFLRHWRELVAHPVVATGMFVLKFVEFVGVAQVAAEQWVLRRRTQRFSQVYPMSASESGAPGHGRPDPAASPGPGPESGPPDGET